MLSPIDFKIAPGRTMNQPVNWSEKITGWIGTPTSIFLHSVFFVGIYVLRFFGWEYSDINLILTTVVSLEAIYLSLFIQLSVNRQAQNIQDVAEDIGEISEDIDEIEKDVDRLEKDVDEIEEDVDHIERNIDEVEKNVDEIEEDVKELSEDSEMDAMEDKKIELTQTQINSKLESIEQVMSRLIAEIDSLKK